MKLNQIKLFALFACSASCSFVLSQSLGDQFNSQERTNKLKTMRDSDEQSIETKRDRPYSSSDLIQRGELLRCNFSSASSAAGSTYDTMELQSAVSKSVLIDSSTVRADYSPSTRSYEAGGITGVLVKNGPKIQSFKINELTGDKEESPYWEFDTVSNVIFINSGTKIFKGNCSLHKFTGSK
jgi:hypothetical protein